MRIELSAGVIDPLTIVLSVGRINTSKAPRLGLNRKLRLETNESTKFETNAALVLAVCVCG